MRWQLEGCGDGIYNNTQYSFEQCDKAAEPPQSPSNTFKYPSSANWVRKDVFYDTATRTYYTCSDICLRQAVDLCGDRYESNGPYAEAGWSLGAKDTREYCDDGNTVNGDGCSSTCTVEPEWECKNDPGTDLWGLQSCRPLCGNGILDDPYPTAAGGTKTEICDLGTTFNGVTGYNNDGDVYANACSTTCEKKGLTIGTDYHLWECSSTGSGRTKYSVCTFLCGNGNLDTANHEPCDRLDRPYVS